MWMQEGYDTVEMLEHLEEAEMLSWGFKKPLAPPICCTSFLFAAACAAATECSEHGRQGQRGGDLGRWLRGDGTNEQPCRTGRRSRGARRDGVAECEWAATAARGE